MKTVTVELTELQINALLGATGATKILWGVTTPPSHVFQTSLQDAEEKLLLAVEKSNPKSRFVAEWLKWFR